MLAGLATSAAHVMHMNGPEPNLDYLKETGSTSAWYLITILSPVKKIALLLNACVLSAHYILSTLLQLNNEKWARALFRGSESAILSWKYATTGHCSNRQDMQSLSTHL